jgi:alkylhydroperoxidase/carboxymuconolactone decarboxylase family protein YurZ
MADDPGVFTRLHESLEDSTVIASVMRRPGIDDPTRAMLALSMVAARGEASEVAACTRRCVANGLGRSEGAEVLLQVYCYAGVYAGLSGFSAARTAFDKAIQVFDELEG